MPPNANPAAVPSRDDMDSLRWVLRLVALLNLDHFGVECAIALSIGPASLIADSNDFLEGPSVIRAAAR